MDNPIEFSVGQPVGYGFSVSDSVGVTVIGVADVVVNDKSVVDEDKVARFSVPTQLSQLFADNNHRTVTDTEKSTWNDKGTYSKPSGGIPKTDLDFNVQTSLGKADNAIGDAPSDGNQYARKDGAWAVVQGGDAVNSVNGKTGAVVLNADDVNSAPVWQSTVTYAAGVYCIHGGYLWHNTSGAASTGIEPGTNYNVWNVTYSNRNLLDNPWFTVNQRGITSFQGGAYGVDRWVCPFLSPNCSIEVTENGIHFTNAAGPAQNCVLDQFIEKSRIPAETQVTLSVLYADGTVENDSGLPNQGIFVPNSRLGQASLAPLEDTYRLRLWQSIVGENTVRAVKLELGSVSTLANDTAPNYAEELAKCQRYYFEINQIVYFPATSQTDGSAEVFIPTPVTMRTVPSVSYTDLLSIGLRQGAAIGSPSSISPIACVPNGICLNLIAYYIQRSGAPMTFYPTTGAHLAFSADL